MQWDLLGRGGVLDYHLSLLTVGVLNWVGGSFLLPLCSAKPRLVEVNKDSRVGKINERSKML